MFLIDSGFTYLPGSLQTDQVSLTSKANTSCGLRISPCIGKPLKIWFKFLYLLRLLLNIKHTHRSSKSNTQTSSKVRSCGVKAPLSINGPHTQDTCASRQVTPQYCLERCAY